jgi:hypothetical protein
VTDHLNFRDRMKEANTQGSEAPEPLRLQKPTALSAAAEPWFAKFYQPGLQRVLDRLTFSRR